MSRFAPWIIPAAAALISAAIAHWHFGKSFWLVFLIVFFGVTACILFNGMVIMLEDEMPGGFNNPDGTETPLWIQRARKIMWAILGFLILLVGLAVWASKAGYW